MVDEIIFIKDGRISLNAAIDVEEPAKSIYTYFNEKFSPFTTDEEKKVYESKVNDFKSGFVSTMNAEISYNAALNKINKAFSTLKNNTIEDKSVFAIHNNLTNENNNEEKKNITDLARFDINGGAIKNDDGSYQYLKILDIRKNEHFGLVFMTLKKPCPLTLQVKSKFAELYNLKKEVAISISKDYPNIWKKLYGKEFHNLTSIKKMTFKALNKYIELNKLLLDLNVDEGIGKNDITVNYLNELEKSLCADKSMFSQYSKKNLSLRRGTTGNSNYTKFKTMNSDFDKKMQRLSISKIHVDNPKEKQSKKIKFRGNKISNSIIVCNNSNKDKILQLVNNHFPFSSKKVRQTKSVHFNDEKIHNTSSNKNELSKNKLMKKISSSEIYTFDANDSEKKMGSLRQWGSLKKNDKKEKLKKLQQFLISLQKKIKTKCFKDKEFKNHSVKGILKNKNSLQNKSIKYQISLNKGKNIEPNSKINNNDDSNDSIINELINYFNDETNFSFCSVNEEKSFNLDELCISHDINLEIISSYSNLNQLSKGKYIRDKEFQKQIRTSMKNFYSNKSNNKVKISSPSINIFTNSEENVHRYKNKKSHKKTAESQKKKIQIHKKN